MVHPCHDDLAPDDQARLWAAAHHPTGHEEPFDWQASPQTMPERVADLARRFPDRLAVYDPQQRLTYQELDQAANRVANALLARRGPHSEAVAVWFGVDVAASIAALGVLKAGKFFVGLDDSFPPARQAHLLDDAQTHVILTDDERLPLARSLAGDDRLVLPLSALENGDPRPPDAPLALDALALLNYTSGSTGLPKGVAQTHHSARAHAVRYASRYRLSDADRLALVGGLAWAGSFWDIFGPLCLGGAVSAFDIRRYGLSHFADWVASSGITVMSGLTVVRRLAYDYPERRYPAVRLVQLGGDTVYRTDVAACLNVFPHALIAVGFGLTEAGRVAEQLVDHQTSLPTHVVSVGYETPGVRILLLSDSGDAVAPGDSGEIAVQSEFLAPGYWRQPELTAARFRRALRFGDAPIYLTGDIGRWLPNGALQHLGRADFMFKVRGLQVQTSDIEGRLLEVEGVREACVVAQTLDEGDRRLIAYLVVESGVDLTLSALQAYLSASLPAHMLPQRFVFVDSLPKTPTGKINRLTLPPPDNVRPDIGTRYHAPRTPLEAQVAAMWAEALEIDRVGVWDNFLDLGGDSLQASRVVSRLADALGLNLPISRLFAAPTVAAMSAVILASYAEGMGRERFERLLDAVDRESEEEVEV